MWAVEPITGREELGDLSRPDQALAQFYKAFNTRDMDLMSQNWDSSGESTPGWTAMRQIYESIFASPSIVYLELHNYTLHVHAKGRILLAIGREHGNIEYRGQKLDLSIRATRIFARIGDQWRQTSQCGSFTDPALLESYQRAINNSSGTHKPPEYNKSSV